MPPMVVGRIGPAACVFPNDDGEDLIYATWTAKWLTRAVGKLGNYIFYSYALVYLFILLVMLIQ